MENGIWGFGFAILQNRCFARNTGKTSSFANMFCNLQPSYLKLPRDHLVVL